MKVPTTNDFQKLYNEGSLAPGAYMTSTEFLEFNSYYYGYFEFDYDPDDTYITETNSMPYYQENYLLCIAD